MRYHLSPPPIRVTAQRVASRYLLRTLRYRIAKSKTARIFDFDDTLVSSAGGVNVTKGDGEKVYMVNSAFTYYESADGDVLDFSETNHVFEPRIIKRNFDRLKESLKEGADVIILTARTRGCDTAIADFLKDNGVEGVKVVGLGNGKPSAKGAWVEEVIKEQGYDNVEFYDDSEANAKAVEGAIQKSGVKGESFYTGHPKPDAYAGPASKKVYKAKNPTEARVEVKNKPESGSKTQTSPGSWWKDQTDKFQHHYCQEHPASKYCKTGMYHMAAEETLQDEIQARAKKSTNAKVKKYVTKFVEKLDQAGPAGGHFYESFGSDFDDIRKKPQGLFKDFTSKDFDDLKKVLFG